MEEFLQKRLDELIKERQQFVDNANKTVFGFDVAIGELQNLIERQKNLPKIGELINPQ